MATVWPIESDTEAMRLNQASRNGVCQHATAKYNVAMSLQAIRDAEETGVNLDGKGPYLLAWSPSKKKGHNDALILTMDLSSVETYEQAIRLFDLWIRDIEEDSSLWEAGWNLERLRIALRHWTDKYGEGLVELIGMR